MSPPSNLTPVAAAVPDRRDGPSPSALLATPEPKKKKSKKPKKPKKPRPRRAPSTFPFHQLSDEELITPQSVADWLGVSRPWVFSNSREDSLLKRIHLGHMTTRFLVSDVRAFLRSKAGA